MSSPDTAKKPEIAIRKICRISEMHLVEKLQVDVWGIPALDVVPMAQMLAVQEAGGVVIGAFNGAELIGFAYGFVGSEKGRLTHHSHMLAVKPEFRNFRVGYRLKLAQRDFVMLQGIDEMTWTFDPLQSLNAHFNFARLGVTSRKYLVNFYGEDAASFLHRNGTDRLWVSWRLSCGKVEAKLSGTKSEDGSRGAEALVELVDGTTPRYKGDNLGGDIDKATIWIPSDISSIEKTNEALAAEWRKATRRAFLAAIDAGFTVTDFRRETLGGNYLLERSE